MTMTPTLPVFVGNTWVLHSTLLQHVFNPFFWSTRCDGMGMMGMMSWEFQDSWREITIIHSSMQHASLRFFRSPWLSSPYTKYFAIIICFWFVSQIKYIYIYNVFLQVSFLCLHHFCCRLQKDLTAKMRATSHVKLSNPEIKFHLPSSSLAGIPYPQEPPTWKKKTTSSQATWFISHFSSNIHNNIHNGDDNNNNNKNNKNNNNNNNHDNNNNNNNHDNNNNNKNKNKNNNNNNKNNKAPAFTVLLWEFLLPPLQTFSFMAPHLETQGHLNNLFHQSPMLRWLKRLLHFE